MESPHNDSDSYKLKYRPDWRPEAEIGHGGFGIVFTARVRRPGMLKAELCAVKRIHKAAHNVLFHRYEQEIETLARLLKHEWFVQLFGWYEDEIYVYIVMEYMEHGDLDKHIDFRWKEDDIKVVAVQVLEGLKIMHDDGIIHRDLKPANVFPFLLDDDSGTLRIKIGDFGVSKRLSRDSSTIAETRTGSLAYMAPEVLSPSETGYTNAIDIWGLGCILYRMATGKMPFPAVLDVNRYYFGLSSFPRDDLLAAGISEPGTDLLEALIRPDPQNRITASGAIKSDWITSAPPGFGVTEELRRHFKNWTGKTSASQPPTKIAGPAYTYQPITNTHTTTSTSTMPQDTTVTASPPSPVSSSPEKKKLLGTSTPPKPKFLGSALYCGFSCNDPDARWYSGDDRFRTYEYFSTSEGYYNFGPLGANISNETLYINYLSVIRMARNTTSEYLRKNIPGNFIIAKPKAFPPSEIDWSIKTDYYR